MATTTSYSKDIKNAILALPYSVFAFSAKSTLEQRVSALVFSIICGMLGGLFSIVAFGSLHSFIVYSSRFALAGLISEILKTGGMLSREWRA